MKIFCRGQEFTFTEIDAKEIRFEFEDGTKLDVGHDILRSGKECIKITGFRQLVVKPVVSNQVAIQEEDF